MSTTAALSALSRIFGNRFSVSAAERIGHGGSESHFDPMPPDAVVWPETSQEVIQIVNICATEGVAVIGWGAGTSLEAQAQAPRGGIAVDFSRMARVLEVRAEDMDCTVQPGITRQDLDAELRHSGLFFPVDPGANASIGGMAMTRASGTTTVRYGTMRDNVMGLEVVLADGRIIQTGSRARKSSAGYDLTGLMVGSEGTLGLVTALTLRLHGRPEAVASAVCAFSRIEDAVTAVIETIQSGIPVARIEFTDAATAIAFNAYKGTNWPAVPHLMVEFHGSDASVAEDARRFGEIVIANGGEDFKWALKEEDRRALWAMRHEGYYAILASRKGARALVTDVCVPLSRLGEAVETARAKIEESPISGPILGHMGDGNFHAILMVDPNDPNELDAAKRLSNNLVECALDMGGTATGEHGVGLGKLAYMDREHGEAWHIMGEIKRSLDPYNILNPGKLVPGN